MLLSAALPGAALLALPTTPTSDGARVRAELPAEAAATDLPRLLAAEAATGAAGEVVGLPLPAPGLPERLLLVGTGDGTADAWRAAGSCLGRRARSSAALAVDLRGLPPGPDGLAALVEGLLLAAYGFRTSSAGPGRVLTTVTLVVGDPAAAQPALDGAVILARAVAAARDLVNTPSLQKSPQWLAEQAGTLLAGLQVTVREERELAAEGFGGIVAVGMGSARPPRLVEATYEGTGRGRLRHVVLVGKGITFDSGGLSLKSNEGMQTMKADMAGAAAVLAAVRAAADLALPLRVTALAAVAENMPGGGAQRPGDVIRQYGGRTVEVLNTDAEGRLVLADAIAYADRALGADVIVDVATLTGGISVALGRRYAGLFASDDALAGQLLAAAARSGERLWRLPLVEDYRAALDSATADLRNTGDPHARLSGGSIVAALFLREFAGGRPWAHLDIAGPAWSGADEEELVKGGTGYGVRLLVRWLQDLAALPVPRRARRTAA